MSSELMFVHLTNIEASKPYRATPYVMGAQSRSVVVNPLSRVDEVVYRPGWTRPNDP